MDAAMTRHACPLAYRGTQERIPDVTLQALLPRNSVAGPGHVLAQKAAMQRFSQKSV